MMYPQQPSVIGPLDTAERKAAYFNFKREVAPSTNLLSATVEVELVSGTDADPQGMVVGTPLIDNTQKLVAQDLIGVGRNGNTYNIRCICPDSTGHISTVAALMQVVFLVTD